MQFLNRLNNLLTSSSQNDFFDYVKQVLYQTSQKEEIRERDRAFRLLFAGMDKYQEKDFAGALEMLQHSRSVFRKEGDDLGESFCYYFLAEVYRGFRDSQKALECYRLSFEGLQKQGNRMAYAVENKIKELES